MKRAILVTGLVAVASLTAAVVLGAPPETPSGPESKAPAMSCPCCGMMMGGQQSEAKMKEHMKEMEAKMKEAGVSDQTMQMRQAMRHAPLYPDSPDMLLGQATTLGLTDDQKAKLGDVLKDSRTKALAVLTDEQRTKLTLATEKPMTMTDMQSEMKKKMEPMMQKMMQGHKGDEMMK